MRVFGNCILRAGSYQVLVSGKNCKSRVRVRLENVEPQRVKHETATNICPREDLRTQDGTTNALRCRTR